MMLSDIFHIYNGVASSDLKISENRTEENSIAFLRPSNSWSNLIVGYLNENEIPAQYIFKKDTLFVSTNGEGSHSFSYVSPIDFVPNSDISVLIPKKEMSINEKLFYAMCITKNRYRFSYGRKPKGDRLSTMILPESPFKWVKGFEFSEYGHLDFSADSSKRFNLEDTVSITKLFDITYGTKLDLNKMDISYKREDSIAFVSRTARNLGVVEYVEKIDGLDPYPAGLITVALGGSILSTFLQPHKFYTAQNIIVLVPIKEMTIQEKLFYCMCIEQNKFKYTAFGREANVTFKTLTVPKKVPSWVKNFDIAKYINH